MGRPETPRFALDAAYGGFKCAVAAGVVDCAIKPVAQKAPRAKTAKRRYALRTNARTSRLRALSTRLKLSLIDCIQDYRADARTAQGQWGQPTIHGLRYLLTGVYSERPA